jgi:alanine-glyoxylate transaminase / serine-glyoxylate transaminase / serine-pyruvate transaminase
MQNTPSAPLRILMGPGPSDVHPRVLAAMARPTVGHLDPYFGLLMEDTKDLLRYAFKTKNDVVLPVSAPASAGMEMCFVNLIEPGDAVIVASNGVFGQRMKENVERIGGELIHLDHPWGQPVDPERVRAAFREHKRVKLLAFVHAETSTGVRSDAAALCAIAKEHGALSIVDAVTSLGGIPVEVDAWGADAVYSGSQKCLSAPPGLSPITFSARAVEMIKARKTKVQSWFLDLSLVLSYWSGEGARSYHHTAPVNAIYGLNQALRMLREEGLEASWRRHMHYHKALRDGLIALGFSFLVDEPYRLPELNTVLLPDGVDDAKTRRYLLDKFGIEVGGGLGKFAGKLWRIGLMGQSASRHNVTVLLAAVEAALAPIKGQAAFGRGTGAAAEILNAPLR